MTSDVLFVLQLYDRREFQNLSNSLFSPQADPLQCSAPITAAPESYRGLFSFHRTCEMGTGDGDVSPGFTLPKISDGHLNNFDSELVSWAILRFRILRVTTLCKYLVW
jgi:hypothetical protein